MPGKGLLFIGDPHLSSRRPGRRTDADFAGTVLGKLDQALTLAREQEWVPVILGDLFDRGDDNSLSMLTRLLRLLRTHREQGGEIPLCLVGNHDLRDTDLADDTAMGLLRETSWIRILETKHDPEPVTIEGVVHLLPVSYGKSRDALSSIAKSLKAKDRLPVIALTHEDFDFQGAYPGASIMEEIPGVDMVVNGHMHKPAPWVKRGKTLWCNPGNITRMSIDCEGYPPSVWSWTPDMGSPDLGVEQGLVQHVLVHQSVVFDRTGLRVAANEGALREAIGETLDAGVSVGAERPLQQSQQAAGSDFAALLKNQQFGTVTEDAGILREELDAVLREQRTDDVTAGILLSLLQGIAGG